MNTATTRLEHDLLGDKEVPTAAYYGVHTLRALENFPITGITIAVYPDLVRALALGAKAALIGRPWAMAMAAGGEAALIRYLTLMRQDMKTALGLSGAINARDVTQSVLL